MLHTLRAKLIAITATTALAFLLLVAIGDAMSVRVASRLRVIREQHIPRVELGPKLAAEFDAVRRGLQDAVAAQDRDAIEATRARVEQFHRTLAQAAPLVDPRLATELRAAFDDYYGVASDVSRRMVAGDEGESMVDSFALMQAKQQRAQAALTAATAFDHGALRRTFDEAAELQRSAATLRLTIGLACFALILAMCLWVLRVTLGSLRELGQGLQRFGTGKLDEPIVVVGRDEIAEISKQANAMGRSLSALNEERDRSDWLKAGHAAVVVELRGELEPSEAAKLALVAITKHLQVPLAALYYEGEGEALELLAQLGGSSDDGGASEPRGALPTRFRRGEGLIGGALTTHDISVITDLPSDYLKVRSALGEAQPVSVVFVPLVIHERVVGVIELGLFRPWAERKRDLLLSVRESIVIALGVAKTRVTLRKLLRESQDMTRRLTAQEEELRATNEELQAQQEELREANEELVQHSNTLEAQRRTLQEKNVELDEARRTVEQKAEQLSTVSAYKSQFLANMSHELRTPLNSMLLLSNMMADNEAGNLTPKQVEFCRTIHGAGRDLLALINQVLDLAKIEAGKQETTLETVRIQELTERAERMFGPMARHKGLAFEVELASDAPSTIVSDAHRVDQVITNLVGNAIKFTEQGSVKLRIARPGPDTKLKRRDLRLERCVAFSVTDTGIGIASDDQERVFAPFEQIDGRSVRRYGGTGLGLSIVRELSTLLGGELQLRSTPGQGSTFTCYLPEDGSATHPSRAKVAGAATPPPTPTTPTTPTPQAPPTPPATEAAPAPLPPIPSGPHLLIVEDDRVFAELIGEVVRAQGLAFVIASDGRSALELAKQGQPLGIVLDVRLADIDGFMVLQALRAHPDTAKIPVHFVSAVEAAERGIAMGAIGYLTKPASREDLVGVVEALVPRVADRKLRVLIVEDDAEVADSLVKRLGAEATEAVRAVTAAEALDALAKERFHCMVLDLALPDMDGLQFLQFLQEQRGSEMPPVVVYTARPLSKAETQRLEAYADAIVLKEGTGDQRVIDEIRLFATRSKQGLPAKRDEQVPRVHPVAIRLDGRKVLVVDDDMRTVYALSALLRAKGLEVFVAENGRVAVEMLAQHPQVDAVLMDLMMPEMDGYEAMRAIRKDPQYAKLPIVALTAKAMKGDREKCLEAGATDYLPKPVDAQRLMEVLHAQLGGE